MHPGFHPEGIIFGEAPGNGCGFICFSIQLSKFGGGKAPPPPPPPPHPDETLASMTRLYGSRLIISSLIKVKYNRLNLLTHPLVGSLLHYKWTGFGLYGYFLNLLAYCVFLIFLTAFALTVENPRSQSCKLDNSNFNTVIQLNMKWIGSSVSSNLSDLSDNGTGCSKAVDFVVYFDQHLT